MFGPVDRAGTHAYKWERDKGKNLIPLWVADMDLASPQAIVDALSERARHPIYGYTHPWPSLNQSVVDWCQQEYHWAIEANWIVWMPGVVPSFNLACDLLAKGGRVLVQTPNYPPMLQAAERQGGQTVTLPVHWHNDGWQLDWTQLEAEMAHPDCHLFMLCNPMNPNGAVLSALDLAKISALCQQYDVLVCSDEIHCDLILDPVQHYPAGSIAGLEDISITLMAASKTFNVAGLGCSFAIIANPRLRADWQQRMADLVPYPNFMGMIAAEVAFSSCKDWHNQLLSHLKGNRDLIDSRINRLEGLIYRPQPATFLAWIESTQPGLALDQHFIKAGLMPSEGKFFGQADNSRLNFGIDRATLERAMQLFTDYWQQKKPWES
jgi:cystathionine beta-lyase